MKIAHRDLKCANIFITSDGFIYRMNYMGRLEREEVRSIKNYLNCIIHLEEGTTFETFFNIILKDKEFFNEVYKDIMGGFDLSQFTKEWNKVSVKKDVEKISYLEIYRDIELKENFLCN
jgi:serine/threonine protein kinase